jgi:hypothetical protein
MQKWYAKNRDHVLTQIKERRTTGNMAKYERERYANDAEFNKRKKARNAISIRLKRGTIQRGTCEVCGAEKTQAHHVDYNRPLDVRWLCNTHHRAVHGEKVHA